VDATPLVAEWAARDGVGVVPGCFFDAPAHFRIAVGGRNEAIVGGLEQLGRALDRL
jgi:aspartate/methionine/tyrosine aminotransferase